MQIQPPFRKIAGHYRDRITAGADGFKPGDLLPSRREMASKHNRSRDTIDKAMDVLASEGLIVLRGNQRAQIAQRALGVPSMEERMATLRATGKILSDGETCEVLSIENVPCPAEIAVHLGLAEGDEVLRRARITKRNGRPLAVSWSYFPSIAVEAAPELAQPENIEGGARELAAYRLGQPMAEWLESTYGRMANDAEKELLEMTGKFPVVLETLRVVYLDDGRVVEAAVKVSEASNRIFNRKTLNQD
jgi:GntR family transcriptional regulator